MTARSDRTYDARDRLATGVLANDDKRFYGLHPLPESSQAAAARRDVLAFLSRERDFGLPPPPVRLS